MLKHVLQPMWCLSFSSISFITLYKIVIVRSSDVRCQIVQDKTIVRSISSCWWTKDCYLLTATKARTMPELWCSRNWSLFYKNVSPHNALNVFLSFFDISIMTTILHNPYLLDMVASDFLLFPKMKKNL